MAARPQEARPPHFHPATGLRIHPRCQSAGIGSPMTSKIVVSAMAAFFVVAPVIGAAVAQSPPRDETPAAKKPGERQGDQIPASSHTHRLYECRALARAHNFGFHFIRKGKFMRACLAQKS